MAEGGSGRLTDEAAGDIERQLGERLVASQRLDRAGLDRALRFQERHRGSLPGLLASLGLVTERDLARVLSEELGLPLLAPADMPECPVEIPHMSARFLRKRRLLPIAETAEGYRVAMADPLDTFAREAFELAAGRPAILCVAEPATIEAAIDALYPETPGGLDGPREGEAGAGEDLDVERLKDLASEAPVVQLVNALIARAVENRASDIHIEPFEQEFRVRFRIDGRLELGMPVSDSLRAAMISRIKIMARLDIAERRLPQDGRIKTVVRGKAVDLRVSTLPILHGESVVLRVLDRDSVALDLAALGVRAPAWSRLTEILDRPNGIFLVTGPTGSGKTTTLYAALTRINDIAKKIVTVEDPVEYQLAGINQVQVQPGIGLTFANVLRSILRQDPDIVMVGEIRDTETARIAAQAALTGHLVLSTLHTNDAATAVTRMLDMGVEPYLLTSTLAGAAAQRLVRRLCPDCREPFAAPPEVVAQYGLDRLGDGAEVVLHRPQGCARCRGQGYLGRVMLVEILTMSDALRTHLLERAEATELERIAIAEGMRTMFEDGVAKALDGTTTLEEVLRTTREA